MGIGQGGGAEPGVGNQAPSIQPIELHRALSIAAVAPIEMLAVGITDPADQGIIHLPPIPNSTGCG